MNVPLMRRKIGPFASFFKARLLFRFYPEPSPDGSKDYIVLKRMGPEIVVLSHGNGCLRVPSPFVSFVEKKRNKTWAENCPCLGARTTLFLSQLYVSRILEPSNILIDL